MTAARQVRLSSPCDRPAVEQLLRAGFGDEEEFLRAFFEHIYSTSDTLLSLDGDDIAGMTTLIPCDVIQKGMPPQPALYLYSLTTLPAFRGRGHARAILDAAKQKCDRIFLHAADEKLFDMYLKLGWQPMMHARYETVPAASFCSHFRALSGEEYYHLRENALRDTTHIRWTEATCRFLHDMLTAYGGGLYAAENALVAVQEAKDGVLYVDEAFGEDAPQLIHALAAQYHCCKALLLTPCSPDAVDAFPMAQGVGAQMPEPVQISFVFQ